jgi:ribulose 1,5-bisphosphate carboxylase large subunit-like protein
VKASFFSYRIKLLIRVSAAPIQDWKKPELLKIYLISSLMRALGGDVTRHACGNAAGGRAIMKVIRNQA